MVVEAKEAWQITRQGFYRPAYVDEYQKEHEKIANHLAHNANFMAMACAIVECGIDKALLKDAKHGGDILPVYMTLTTDTQYTSDLAKCYTNEKDAKALLNLYLPLAIREVFGTSKPPFTNDWWFRYNPVNDTHLLRLINRDVAGRVRTNYRLAGYKVDRFSICWSKK